MNLVVLDSGRFNLRFAVEVHQKHAMSDIVPLTSPKTLIVCNRHIAQCHSTSFSYET